MKRRFLLAVSAALLPRLAEAQPASGIHRIGVLMLAVGEAAVMAELYQRLAALGYREGSNLTIERRSAEGDPARLAPLAAELVASKPDLLIAGFGTLTAKALKAATSTIPIVFVRVGDPVGAGVVAALNRPGGNVTGTTDQASELSGKRLDLLRELTGGTRFAVLLNPDTPFSALALADLERAAQAQSIRFAVLKARTHQEVTASLSSLRDGEQKGLLVLEDPTNDSARGDIVSFARQNRLATMFLTRDAVLIGGLIAYGVDRRHSYRRAAEYVDKILKGAKPADLPVEQPTQFHLVINLGTAKAIGVDIPPRILALADEVVE